MIEAQASRVPRTYGRAAGPAGKGRLPKELSPAGRGSWDGAEYAVYCHEGGALSGIPESCCDASSTPQSVFQREKLYGVFLSYRKFLRNFL